MGGCCNREVSMKVMYHEDTLKRIENIEIGDWTDLRSAEDITMVKGEFKFISLGISVQVPSGYEMHIAPRSSTYKNFGIIQANSVGILDESYCGSTDVIKFPAIALQATCIEVNDRICQFRLMRKQPKITFVEVADLDDNKSRGGFGSTGTK